MLARAEPIVIELEGEPIGKGRPRFVRATGRVYTPEKTREYETRLRVAGRVAMAGRPPMDGPLMAEVLAIFPVPESWSGGKTKEALAGLIFPTVTPDADNLIKVLDALNEVVFADDKQIVAAQIVKRYGAHPCLRVAVRSM